MTLRDWLPDEKKFITGEKQRDEKKEGEDKENTGEKEEIPGGVRPKNPFAEWLSSLGW